MIDKADVLLKMHPEVAAPAPAPAPKPEPPAPVAAAPVDDVEAPEPEPKTAIPEIAAVEVVEQPAPIAEEEDASVVVAFETAAKRLASVGSDLAEVTAPEPRQVLKHSAEALDWLGLYLEEADLPDTPAVVQARAMTQDAVDLVQLLRMEKADGAGTEAVLAVLQLKRGFQAALAA